MKPDADMTPVTPDEDPVAIGIAEIFRDGSAIGRARGSLSLEISEPSEIDAIRVFICHPRGAIGAEVTFEEIVRASSTIKSSGALSCLAACTISSLERDEEGGASMILWPCAGEISAALGESMSRDVVHVQISRAQIPIARIEVDRGDLDLLCLALSTARWQRSQSSTTVRP
jgi:hypothetical protein